MLLPGEAPEAAKLFSCPSESPLKAMPDESMTTRSTKKVDVVGVHQGFQASQAERPFAELLLLVCPELAATKRDQYSRPAQVRTRLTALLMRW